MTQVRSDGSLDQIEARLRAEPAQPHFHNDYGNFLLKTGDLAGAAAAYETALTLDPQHVVARTNLANVMARRGEFALADEHYRVALASAPPTDDTYWRYGEFLRARGDFAAATSIVDSALAAHPTAGRLHLLRGSLLRATGQPREALQCFLIARQHGAPQAEVDVYVAYALQMSGAPRGESIAAYRLAINLQAGEGALHLNLAQLLFEADDHVEARRQLLLARSLTLTKDAQLELQFYTLAHTTSDPIVGFREIRELLQQGATLRWNVQPNIEAVRVHSASKAARLQTLYDVMSRARRLEALDAVERDWLAGDNERT